MKKALVLGAGGFIGNHMVKRLKSEGYWVRGVDVKRTDFSNSEADEFLIYDLRMNNNVCAVMNLSEDLVFSWHRKEFERNSIAFDEVYQFAADMGGAGYVFTGEHDADVMYNSASINLNVCQWANIYGVGKVFYSSSACIYPQELQKNIPSDRIEHDSHTETGFTCSLSESDAYPANPDSEYGWEKLFSERLYLSYARNYGLNVRMARFHNIYGPEGTYKGGKEKAPAAICRKVIESHDDIINHPRYPASLYPVIEIWGDGEQTRSFLYIDDCIDAVRLLMESEFKEPINIGSEEMVSINQLADLAIEFSGKKIKKEYDLTKPQGVRGRNSNNDLIRKELGWNPKFTLREGLERTYKWINQQINGLPS